VKNPFFISPAYWVPRITAALSLKFKATQVLLPTPGIFELVLKSPALKMVKSTSSSNSLSYFLVGLMSIFLINKAWYGRVHKTLTLYLFS